MQKLKKASWQSGYILPAIMLLSSAILIIATVTMGVVSTNFKSSITKDRRLYAQEAAQAGISAARACISAGITTWSILTPDTTCDGTKAGTPYVLKVGNAESSYSVSPPQDAGSSIVITSVGTTNLYQDRAASIVSDSTTSSLRISYTKQTTPTGYVSKHVSDVSAGLNHACAVAEGKVYCWGKNDTGQLGDTTRNSNSSPVATGTNSSEIPADPGICGLSVLGNCISWTRQPMPAVPISAMLGKTVTKVAAGPGRHSCAIADGKAYCWGNNDYGQLGNRTKLTSYTPVAVYDNPTSIPADPGLCGTSFFGACLSWTRPPTDAVPASPLAGKTVTDISVGEDYTCAVAGGSVICWGNNDRGQLGTRNRTQVSAPTAVYTRPYTPAVVGVCKSYFFGICTKWDPPASNAVDASVMYGKTIVRVTAGSNHSCAFDSSNTMYCWGKNEGGQLGNGAAPPPTSGSESSYAQSWSLNDGCSGSMSGPPQRGPDPNTTDSLEPVAVHVKPAYSYTSWWGATINVPASVLYGKSIQDIRATGNYTSVLADNRIYWFGGADASSTLQMGWSQESCVDKTPDGCQTQVQGASDYCRSSTTVTKSVSIWWKEWAYHMNSKPTGPVYSTQTFFGIPIDSSNNALTNKQLVQTSGVIFGDDSCGTFFGLSNSCGGDASQGTFCALTSTGELYCDGPSFYINYAGTLGDGGTGSGLLNTRYITGPVKVKMTGVLTGKTITKLTSNSRGDYSCVVADEAIYCWGMNANGRLGTGDTTNRYEPASLNLNSPIGNVGGASSVTYTDPVVY